MYRGSYVLRLCLLFVSLPDLKLLCCSYTVRDTIMLVSVMSCGHKEKKNNLSTVFTNLMYRERPPGTDGTMEVIHGSNFKPKTITNTHTTMTAVAVRRVLTIQDANV